MRRLTNEDFINKSKIIWDNFYTYDKTFYINSKTNVCITCPKHGDFLINPSKHLIDRGCPKCGRNKQSQNQSLGVNVFIKKANEIYKNLYDYSLIKEYKNNQQVVEIICKKHGIFKERVNNHLNARGCPLCKHEVKIENKVKELIDKSNEVHNYSYDYSLVCVENWYWKNKVKIICKKCKNIFEQTLNNHSRGKGCPECIKSKAEIKIEKWLIDNKIEYEKQKRFKDCKNKYPLPFDFYLPKYNTCIEYDGEQHFKPIKIFGGSKRLELTKKNDNIKSNFCLNNKITLIRISCKDDIFSKLEESFY